MSVLTLRWSWGARLWCSGQVYGTLAEWLFTEGKLEFLLLSVQCVFPCKLFRLWKKKSSPHFCVAGEACVDDNADVRDGINGVHDGGNHGPVQRAGDGYRICYSQGNVAVNVGAYYPPSKNIWEILLWSVLLLSKKCTGVFAFFLQINGTFLLFELNKFKAFALQVFSSESCLKCVNEALELVGGMGYMKDYPFERYLRDSHALMYFEVGAWCHKIAKNLMSLSRG